MIARYRVRIPSPLRSYTLGADEVDVTLPELAPGAAPPLAALLAALESAFPGIKKHGFGYMTRLFGELEQRIGKGPWAIGSAYTIADPYVAIMHRWGYTAELDMKQFPALSEHSKRVRERPAVQRVIEREGLNPWP